MNSGMWSTVRMIALGALCATLAACAPAQLAQPIVSPTPAPVPAGPASPSPSTRENGPSLVPSPPTPTKTPPETPKRPATPAPTQVPSSQPTPVAPIKTQPPPAGQVPGASGVVPGKNHNAAAAAWAFPAKSVQFWMRNPGKGQRPAKKTVFLTFDDGPSSMTPKVLEVLRRKGVHATFFVIGRSASSNGPMLRRLISEGHSVAGHSYSHSYRYLYPGRSGRVDHIQADHQKAMSAIRGQLGQGYFTSAYRYPGGHMSWRNLGPSDSAFAKQGVYWIDWNSMTGDAEPANRRPKNLHQTVVMAEQGLRARADTVVVLMHDTPGSTLTLQALPQIIDDYRAAGYAFGIIA